MSRTERSEHLSILPTPLRWHLSVPQAIILMRLPTTLARLLLRSQAAEKNVTPLARLNVASLPTLLRSYRFAVRQAARHTVRGQSGRKES